MDCSAWQIADVFVTARGAKIYKATAPEGLPCAWVPAARVRAPFGLSSFDKDCNATRMNMDICVEDEEFVRQCQELDRWAVQYVSEHSERLFKKKMTEIEVLAAYTPCMRPPKDPKYSPLLKTKVDRQGRRAITFWNADGEQGAEPQEWRRYELKVAMVVSHLWQMGASFGLVIQVTDVQLFPREGMEPAARSNPFA